MISGPATDNSVGLDMINNMLKVPAINALTNSSALSELITGSIFPNNLEVKHEN